MTRAVSNLYITETGRYLVETYTVPTRLQRIRGLIAKILRLQTDRGVSE